MPIVPINAMTRLTCKFPNWLVALVPLAVACLFLFGCQSGKAAPAEKAAAPATIHLEPFIVNLADNDGRSLLRIGIDLRVESAGTKSKSSESAPADEPIMRDSIIALLSTWKSDDLLTPEGKKKLKQDLLKMLNDRMPEMKMREIYFTEFMVQR